MKKKIIILLVVVMCVLLIVSACENGENDDMTLSVAQSDTSDVSTEELTEIDDLHTTDETEPDNKVEKPTEEIFYYEDGSIAYWNEYEYNANGNLIKKTNNRRDGLMAYYTKYEYDENDNMIKEVLRNINDTKLYQYEYYTNGVMSKKIKYRIYSDNLAEKIYEYDINGNEIKYTDYSISYGTLDRTARWYEYEYDINNNRIKDTYYSKDKLAMWYDNE